MPSMDERESWRQQDELSASAAAALAAIGPAAPAKVESLGDPFAPISVTLASSTEPSPELVHTAEHAGRAAEEAAANCDLLGTDLDQVVAVQLEDAATASMAAAQGATPFSVVSPSSPQGSIAFEEDAAEPTALALSHVEDGDVDLAGLFNQADWDALAGPTEPAVVAGMDFEVGATPGIGVVEDTSTDLSSDWAVTPMAAAGSPGTLDALAAETELADVSGIEFEVGATPDIVVVEDTSADLSSDWDVMPIAAAGPPETLDALFAEVSLQGDDDLELGDVVAALEVDATLDIVESREISEDVEATADAIEAFTGGAADLPLEAAFTESDYIGTSAPSETEVAAEFESLESLNDLITIEPEAEAPDSATPFELPAEISVESEADLAAVEFNAGVDEEPAVLVGFVELPSADTDLHHGLLDEPLFELVPPEPAALAGDADVDSPDHRLDRGTVGRTDGRLIRSSS